MSNKYYKIIFDPIVPPVGSIINTDDKIDIERIKRLSELTPLFEYIFNCSQDYDIGIASIVLFLKANYFQRRKMKIENKELKSAFKQIRKESRKLHFHIKRDFRHFNEYVLEKVKNELLKYNNLPDRFGVSYFFQSIDDCYRYILNLPKKPWLIQIIEVEFIKTDGLDVFDNNFTSNFDGCFNSNDFYDQAVKYLLKFTSGDPLFEVLFKGLYKVTNHVPIR